LSKINQDTLLKRYIPLIIFIAILLLDQGSKVLVRDYFNPVETLPFYEQTAQTLEACGLGELDITVRLPRPQAIPLLGNFFWINFHENTGVAFGLLNSLSPNTTRPLFALVALLALGFIIFFYRSLPKGKLLPRMSLIFIMGGAIGNLIDRIIIGRVTDFFDLAVRTPESYKNIWPIFNVADSFIVCGVILLFILMLFEKKNPAPADENKTQQEKA
jgi:signal peptidase II